MPLINPATLKTIINSAPLIIQGASKLIQIIKEKGDDKAPEKDDIPLTIEALKIEVKRLEDHLEDVDVSNVEQIKLIEELAKQNETLANSLRNTLNRLNTITLLSFAAFIIALATIFLSLY